MLEEEEVEVPVSAADEVPKEVSKMDTDETSKDTNASGTDVNMQDAKNAAGTGAENGEPASEEKPVQTETDAKVKMFSSLLCCHVSFFFWVQTLVLKNASCFFHLQILNLFFLYKLVLYLRQYHKYEHNFCARE